MTVEELLRPRYKVIADYPNSEFEVGTIINFPNKRDYYTGNDEWESEFVRDKNQGGQFKFCIKKIEPFPHLFKKLEWWEDRAIEDMPEYVRFKERVLKVSRWLSDIEDVENGWCELVERGYDCHTSHLLPATESEYTNYINSKQNG